METKNKPVYKLTFSAVMVALASCLKPYKALRAAPRRLGNPFEHAADCDYIYFLRS